MKTAISVPDALARRIDESARRHGMTRSEFYRRAAEAYAAELDEDSTTRQINAAIAAAGQPSEGLDDFRRAAGDVVTTDPW
jgi:metal-responsive CopG/Arc/MetJ family transcriptional regulator